MAAPALAKMAYAIPLIPTFGPQNRQTARHFQFRHALIVFHQFSMVRCFLLRVIFRTQ
jgi:hypothetical protein